MDSRSTQLAARTSDMLSVILDRSDQCIMLLGPDNQFVYINPAGRQHLGIGEDELLGLKDWLRLWEDGCRPSLNKLIKEARAGRSSRVEVFYSQPGGTLRWCEVDGTPVSDSADDTQHLLVVARDITALVSERQAEKTRRAAAERELEMLDGVAREMRHRFKNQLAVIASLLRLTARHAGTVPELTNRMEQRLAALARAQDFLAVHRGGQMGASDALQQILRASGAGERVSVTDWPEVTLGDEAVQQLALILGELQTNALKHGALTTDRGRITLSAQLEENRLAVLWEETGGCAVTPPQGTGGGLKLLERMGSLPGAKASVAWREDGCSICFYVKVDR